MNTINDNNNNNNNIILLDGINRYKTNKMSHASSSHASSFDTTQAAAAVAKAGAKAGPVESPGMKEGTNNKGIECFVELFGDLTKDEQRKIMETILLKFCGDASELRKLYNMATEQNAAYWRELHKLGCVESGLKKNISDKKLEIQLGVATHRKLIAEIEGIKAEANNRYISLAEEAHNLRLRCKCIINESKSTEQEMQNLKLEKKNYLRMRDRERIVVDSARVQFHKALLSAEKEEGRVKAILKRVENATAAYHSVQEKLLHSNRKLFDIIQDWRAQEHRVDVMSRSMTHQMLAYVRQVLPELMKVPR